MITRVTLQDWKSHRETELQFSSGVNALVGEMGSGKTAVLEAITFGLYGKLPAVQERKISLDDLIRRSPSEADSASVEIEFQRDGDTYTVSRTIERGKGTTDSRLRQDGNLLAGPQTKEVTEKVEQLLGIDFDLFTQIAYSEQNQLDFFLELPPSERKETIDQLLKLDRFEDARSNLVTLKNRIKDRHQDRKDALQELRDEIDEDERTNLHDQISELRDEIDELKEQRAAAEETKEQLKETVTELKDKKQQYEQLTKAKNNIDGQIDSLKERQQELDNSTELDLDSLDSNEIEDRIDQIQERQEKLQDRKESIENRKQELEQIEDRINRINERINKLQEQQEKLQDLDDIQNHRKDLEEQIDENKEQKAELEAAKEQAEETIQSLSKAADTCPACGQELTEEHRVEMLQESKETRDQAAEQIKELDSQISNLEEQLQETKKREKELLSYSDTPDKLDEQQDQLEELQEQKEEVQEKIDELQEEYNPDRQEELENRLDELERANEYVNVVTKIEEKNEKRKDIQDQLDELSFDEKELEKKQEQLQDAEKTIEVATNKIKDRSDLLEEKEKRLEEIKAKEEKLQKMQEEAERYDAARDFLERYKTALERTQQAMREQFIASANHVMQQVWSTVYPYDDYSTIRLQAGEDYILQLKDDRFGWVPVEGEVSGGERHAAALALRIALSKVLAPDLNLLILDEPTHNLDSRAIDDMAATLRDEVAGLMDQLFLITHEEQLEAAVTGRLYNLQKKDTGHGTTEIEEASYS